MSPQELNNLLQKIKELPDKLLNRVGRVVAMELLERSEIMLKEIQELRNKGQHES